MLTGRDVINLMSNPQGELMRNSVLTLSVAAALAAPGLVAAQTAPAPAASPSPLTGNMAIVSDYRFRGISQTFELPAIQGGIDYAHPSGVYLGNWNSSVSGISFTDSAGIEMDFYGGFKKSFGDIGFDIGLLQYYYPGTVAPGKNRADTTELYGALSWKWLSAKLSYSVGDRTFAVADSQGTYYLDLSATYPITDKFNLLAHYGIQKFKGNDPALIGGNDSNASYKDWKLGVAYALPANFTVGAYYTDTTMDDTQRAFYTTPAGREVGKGTATLYIQKTF